MHRHHFELPAVDQAVGDAVEEMSVDGGKVRLKTSVGEPCEWRDYKAANLDGVLVGAFYQANKVLWD